MARHPRLTLPGISHHIVQRGIDRIACFRDVADFAVYRSYLGEAANQRGVAVHAYVMMTNHVHLLATPHALGAISLLMQDLGRNYVRYFNDRHGRTGSLWEGRFHGSIVGDDRYALECARYIELNPVRAGMVSDPGRYAWSSYHGAALGAADLLLTVHPSLRWLAGENTAGPHEAWRRFVSLGVPSEQRDAIRQAVHRGTPYAGEAVTQRLGLGPEARRRPRGKGRWNASPMAAQPGSSEFPEDGLGENERT